MTRQQLSVATQNIQAAGFQTSNLVISEDQVMAQVEINDPGVSEFQFYPPMGFTISSFAKAGRKYVVCLAGDAQNFDPPTNPIP